MHSLWFATKDLAKKNLIQIKKKNYLHCTIGTSKASTASPDAVVPFTSKKIIKHDEVMVIIFFLHACIIIMIMIIIMIIVIIIIIIIIMIITIMIIISIGNNNS